MFTLLDRALGYRLFVVELVLSSIDTGTVQQLSYQLMLHTDTQCFGCLLGNMNFVRASLLMLFNEELLRWIKLS